MGAPRQKQHPRKYFLNSSCFSLKLWYNILMNKIINYLSILAGQNFRRAYYSDTQSRKAEGWLNVYIGLRQMLPIELTKVDSNHYGNHFGSGYKPWKATQGIS